MSHALATVLHRGRKAASNVMTACVASSREARRETAVCRRAWPPLGKRAGKRPWRVASMIGLPPPRE
jgi:hypothetical protein